MGAFVCSACSLSTSKDVRKCPACGTLNSLVYSEEAVFHAHLPKATAKMLLPRVGMGTGFGVGQGAAPLGAPGGHFGPRGFSLDRDDDEDEDEAPDGPRIAQREATRFLPARGRPALHEDDEEEEESSTGTGTGTGDDEEKYIMLSEVEDVAVERISTGDEAFDRVFGEDEVSGSGMPRGCGILLWGDSGLGKTTRCLEILVPWAKAGIPVAYGCGEMHVQQVKQYVKRLCLDDAEALSRFVLYPGTSFDEYLEVLENYRSPEGYPIGAAVTDSITVFYMEDLISKFPPGTARQMKSISEIGTKHAQQYGYGQIFICHVTKGGDMAGPKTVQHHVDICIEAYLEHKADPKIVAFRNASKTRFGRADTTAYFVMDDRTGRLTPCAPDGSFDPGTVEASVRTNMQRKFQDQSSSHRKKRVPREETHLEDEPVPESGETSVW